MTLGLMLLSANGVYVGWDGKLPLRPSWDKDFLVALCRDKNLLCSSNTLIALPPKILVGAKSVAADRQPFNFDVNLGVETFKEYPVDLLLITRSKEEMTGKVFRLDDYSLLLQKDDLELWILNKV